MNTKADHEHGSHPNQAAHAAKGLEFYAIPAGTPSYPSRAAALAAAGEGGKVAKLNPHLTADQQAAQDAEDASAG